MTTSILTITETENGFNASIVIDAERPQEDIFAFQDLSLVQKYAVALHQLGNFDPIVVIALVLALDDGNSSMAKKALNALLLESKGE
jgi:hypothetical protein